MAFDGTLKFDTAIDKSGLESGISGLADKAKSVAGGALSGLGNLAASAMQATTAAVTAATGAVAALGTKAVASGKEFEAGMSQVQATLGLSISDVRDNVNGAADTMAALTAKAEEMGATTAFTAAQAADGLNILAMSGYDAETSIDMIGNVLSLAAAGGLSLGDAASFTAGAMKGFAAEAAQFADATEASGHYADMIAKGATLAATDVYNLGAALSDAAASASAYGQSSTETEVALLRLAEQGVTGTAASTSLAAAMKNLYAPTDQAKAALESLGVSAYDNNGIVRDFNTVVDELGTALAGITDGAARTDLETTIFGIQGKNAFDKMVVSSADTVQKFYDGLANSDGSAGMQAEVMLDNLEGDMTLLGSAADGLYNSLYKSLNEPLRDLAKTGSGYLSTLTKAFSVGGFQGLAGALGGVLSQAVAKVSGYMPKLVKMGSQVISSLVKGLSTNAPKLAQTAVDLGLELLEGVGDVSADLLELGAALLVSLADGIEERMPRIRKTAQEVVKKLAESLSKNVPEMVGAAVEILEMLSEVIIDNLPLLLDAGKEIILSIAKMLSDPERLRQLTQSASDIVGALVDFLCDPEILTAVLDAAIAILLALVDGLLSDENLEKLVDAAFNIIDALANSLMSEDNLSKLLASAIRIITTLCEKLLTEENIEKLLQASADIVDHLVDAIVNNTDDLLFAAERIITALANDFTKPENVRELVSTGVGILTKIIVGLFQIAWKLMGFNMAMQGELNRELFGGDVDWTEIGAAILDGIIEGLFGIDEQPIHDFIEKMHSMIADNFGEAAWDGIGQNIVRGIVDGMLSMFTGGVVSITVEMAQFASLFTSSLQDAFQIQSPSKVMKREVGRYLAQGVGVGFTEEMPEVSQDAAFSAVSAFRRVRDETMGAVEAFRAAAPSITGGRDVSPSALASVVNNYYSSRTVQQQTVQQGGAPARSGDIIIPVQIGNEQVETVVVRAAQIANARSGGVTI